MTAFIMGMLAALILVVSGMVTASDPCNCRGYAGTGGLAYDALGGPCYDGLGDPCCSGPGSAESAPQYAA